MSAATTTTKTHVVSLGIERLRGILSGDLSGLAPLTMLVGPSGSGKSTILDALLIGTHPLPGEALGRAVARRGGFDGARWLRHRRAPSPDTAIAVTMAGGPTTRTSFREELGPSARAIEKLERRGARGPFTHYEGTSEADGSSSSFVVTLAFDGSYYPEDDDARELVRNVRLIDSFQPFLARPLASRFQELRDRGHDAVVGETVRSLFPGFDRIEVAAASDGSATLHLSGPDSTIPLDFVGDGGRLAIRCAIELAGVRSGLALLEEPEAHLHPRGVSLLAGVIAGVVERGVQVIVSTHSLELIDALVEHAGQLGIEDDAISLVRTLLRSGSLVTDVLTGADVKAKRTIVEEDLR